jgi:hypothetical protein
MLVQAVSAEALTPGTSRAGKAIAAIISVRVRIWICLFIDDPPYASFNIM